MEDEEILVSLAKQLGSTVEELKEQVKSAEEVNPMLGLRGCRLGITRPSIIEMQTRAIIEAALNAIDDGVDAKADIMVPLVGKVEEFRDQAVLIRSVAAQVFEERGKSCPFKVGTMIEIPRAALTAHKIAEEANDDKNLVHVREHRRFHKVENVEVFHALNCTFHVNT